MKQLRPGLLPVIALVVVVVWALFAVLMLTGTLVAANTIQKRVVSINETYPEVAQDTGSIPLAFETGKIAGEINEAVKPIGPQFTQIVDAVKSIDASVTGIGESVASINTSVHEINGTVHTIGGVVGDIQTGLTAVNKNVQDINDTAHGIKRNFDQILGNATEIDDRLVKADHQVEHVIDGAKGIRGDLDAAIPVVGDILKNAKAIADSPVINLRVAEIPGALLSAIVTYLTNNGVVLPVSLPDTGVVVSQPAPAAAPLPAPAEAPAVQAPAPAEAPAVQVPAPAEQAPAQDGGVLGSISSLFN